MFEIGQRIQATLSEHGVTAGKIYTIRDMGEFDSIFVHVDGGACKCFANETAERIFQPAPAPDPMIEGVAEKEAIASAVKLAEYCESMDCENCPFHDGIDCVIAVAYPRNWEVDRVGE